MKSKYQHFVLLVLLIPFFTSCTKKIVSDTHEAYFSNDALPEDKQPETEFSLLANDSLAFKTLKIPNIIFKKKTGGKIFVVGEARNIIFSLYKGAQNHYMTVKLTLCTSGDFRSKLRSGNWNDGFTYITSGIDFNVYNKENGYFSYGFIPLKLECSKDQKCKEISWSEEISKDYYEFAHKIKAKGTLRRTLKCN